MVFVEALELLYRGGGRGRERVVGVIIMFVLVARPVDRCTERSSVSPGDPSFCVNPSFSSRSVSGSCPELKRREEPVMAPLGVMPSFSSV